MRTLRRALRFLGHLALSAASLAWFVVGRRGATVVFTHAPDLDAEGRDPQMGPLVEGLRTRGRAFVEVTFVSLDGGLLANLRAKRRPFVSHALLAGAARLLAACGLPPGEAARRVGSAFLALLGPDALFAIDESGSGQILVRGARARGIPAIGIQHGDFQPANPQYAREALAGKDVLAVDRLCLWSAWFQARLLAISPIYDASNTLVTGRLRFTAQARPRAGPSARPVVLLVAEADPDFHRRVKPFLAALAAAADIELVVRPHPAEPAGRWAGYRSATDGLDAALAEAEVVVGIGSSALLEATWAGRPVILLPGAPDPDPAGYGREEIGIPCPRPADLPGLCRAAALRAGDPFLRQRIWGPDADVPALERILAAAHDASTSGA
jgi:hypothetical protein